MGPLGPSPVLANALPIGHKVPPEPLPYGQCPFISTDTRQRNRGVAVGLALRGVNVRFSFTSGARPAAVLARKRPKTVNILSQNPIF